MARTNVFTKLTAALAAVASLTIGCGTDHSPVASNPEPTLTPPAEERILLSFAPGATQVAAKVASNAEERTVSQVFDVVGDKFEVWLKGASGKTDDIRVKFTVPANALAQPETITMTVYGDRLSNLIVAFAPAGLEFLTDAELVIKVGDDLVDTSIEGITVQHEHHDGTVEDAYIYSISDSSPSVKIEVAIPGFSRYSTGGGW